MNAVSSAGSNRLNVDRRGQLIESTIEVIYRDGLSRLTLAKVAHQAGLSTSIVNFYFKTKGQLLLETLQTVSQEYEAAVVGIELTKFEPPRSELSTVSSPDHLLTY